MTDHIVKSYDKELDFLGRKIAEMGGLTEQMIAEFIDGLVAMNTEIAKKVIAADPRLDVLHREIEDFAVLTIARRQPMAVDLREIVAAIRIAADLERVGDLAKNISKRTIKMADDYRLARAIVGLKHMGEIASLQMKEVLDAYAQRNAVQAQNVWGRDAELDALEDLVFRDLLTSMMEDPRNISFCTHLLFCSKNFERMGDHATNIAETVYYLVKGENLPTDRPKGGDARDMA